MKESMTVTRFGRTAPSPRVSVIIPTYKPGEYIRDCLGSLVAQTLDPTRWETIIILNGCDEPYLSEVTDYITSLMQEMDVTLIHTPAGGVSNARNLGLDAARGEYVTFLDDDDYFSPRFLETLVDGAYGADMVISDFLSFEDGDDGNFNHRLVMHNAYLQLLEKYGDVAGPGTSGAASIHPVTARKFYNVSCSKILRLGCIGQTRFNTSFHNGEDSLFMFAVSQRVRTTRLASGDAVYYRRLRPGSAWLRRRPPLQVLRSGLAQMLALTRTYRDGAGRISFKFWLQRLAGVTKDIVRHLLK